MLSLLAGLLASPCGASSAEEPSASLPQLVITKGTAASHGLPKRSAVLPEELLPARKDALVHLLRHDCGSCHGLHLGGGLGPPLTAAVLSGKSAAALEAIIAHGVPGTPMPPWRALLDDAEIRWLVATMQDGRVVDTKSDTKSEPAWRRQ